MDTTSLPDGVTPLDVNNQPCDPSVAVAWRVRWYEKKKRRQQTFASAEEAIAKSEAMRRKTEKKGSSSREGEGERLPRGVTRRGDSYWVRPQVKGLRASATFASLEAAVEWQARAKIALAAGQTPPDPTKVAGALSDRPKAHTFMDALWRWHADYAGEARAGGKYTPRTQALHVQAIEEFLEPFFGGYTLEEIDRGVVRRFRAQISGAPLDEAGHPIPASDSEYHKVDNWLPGYAAEFQRRLLWMIRATYAYAAAEGWILNDRNPAVGIDVLAPLNPIGNPHEPVYISLPTAIAMIDLLGEIHGTGFAVQRFCMLRVSELYGLRLESVDWDLGLLTIDQQAGKAFTEWGEDGQPVVVDRVARTKTPAGLRVVPLPAVVQKRLRNYVETYRTDAKPGDSLFIGPEGGKGSGSYAEAVRRIGEQLGIGIEEGNPPTTHDARRSGITDLEDRGVSLYLRSIWAGHQVSGGVEGSAAITLRSYTLSNPLVGKLVKAGRKLNSTITNHLHSINRKDLAPLSAGLEGFIRMPKAAEIAGVSEDTIRNWVSNGHLDGRKHKFPNQHTAGIWVSQSSVEEIVKRQATQIPLSVAAAQLGMDYEYLRDNLPRFGIEPERAKPGDPLIHHPNSNGHYKLWLTPDSYEQLRSVLADGTDWLERHVPYTQAADDLEVDYKTVLTAIGRGEIIEADPADAPPTVRAGVRWVTRASVATYAQARQDRAAAQAEKAAQKRQIEEAKTGTCTYTQAANLLGRSTATVRDLIKAGVLELHPASTPNRPLLDEVAVRALAAMPATNWRLQPHMMVPAADAAEALNQLVQAGWSIGEIADQLNVARTGLVRIRNGATQTRASAATALLDSAETLLADEPNRNLSRGRIDASQTAADLQVLKRRGWSVTAVHTTIGGDGLVRLANLYRIAAARPGERIPPAAAAAIHQLALSDAAPPPRPKSAYQPRPGRLDPTQTRQELQDLRSAGWTWPQIIDGAGLKNHSENPDALLKFICQNARTVDPVVAAAIHKLATSGQAAPERQAPNTAGRADGQMVADDIQELLKRGWTRAEIHRRIGGNDTCRVNLLDKLTKGLRKTAPPEVAAGIHALLGEPLPPPVTRQDRIPTVEVAKDLAALRAAGWTLQQIRNSLPADTRVSKASLSKIANAGTPQAHKIESVRPEVAAAIRALREVRLGAA